MRGIRIREKAITKAASPMEPPMIKPSDPRVNPNARKMMPEGGNNRVKMVETVTERVTLSGVFVAFPASSISVKDSDAFCD